MAQLVAALDHGSWPVVLPSGCVASLIHLVKRSGSLSSVDHRLLRPVDDMVLLSCVVGESGFVVSVKLDVGYEGF